MKWKIWKLSVCMIVLPLLTAINNYGQTSYEKIWTFGANAGLDFTSGSPVSFYSNIVANEGVATQCDASGQLLFYTNKNAVWDRNHNIMPNGNNLDPTDPSTSTTQGVVAAPWPGQNSKYFIFTIGRVAEGCYAELPYCGYLSYTVVDMSANGGIGDVIATQKGIIIDSSMAEQMIVVQGENCNEYWLIVHNKNDISFKSYRIDTSGLNPYPVLSATSTLGYYYSRPQGSFVYGPATKKIAAALRDPLPTPGIKNVVELFDFNTSTGVVSNPQLLDSNTLTPYGICFSPDETKLYYSDPQVYQLDLSLPTLSAIRASKTLLTTDLIAALKLGPDQKIYLANVSDFNHLSCINKPDLQGTACEYTSGAEAVALVPGTNSELGLPNIMYIHPGIHDTGSVSHTHKRWLCDGKPLVLKAPVTEGTSFTWNDGSTADSMVVTLPGIYWITSNEPCFPQTDTFIVTSFDHRLFLGNDTVICEGDELVLTAPDIEGAIYLWQDGNATSVYTVKNAGTYKLKITAGDCEMEDDLKITVQNCKCRPWLATAFSPNGDGINDTYKPEFSDNCQVKDYVFRIFNRWGQQIFNATEPNQAWDGFYNNMKAEIGTYFYFLSYYQGKTQYLKGDFTLVR